MKRTISLLLALLMLLGLAACIRVPVQKPDTPQPQAVQATAAPAATKAPSAATAPASTAAPAAAATSAPATSEARTEAAETWADIDLAFFREYLASDLTTLHQLVKDPAKHGIDYDSVERSLGSFTRESDEKWYAFERELLARMDRLDYSALSEQDQVAYDTLRQYMEWELEGAEFYGYSEPLTQLTGIQTDIPIVFWFYELNTKQDVEDYLTLLGDLPRYFGELLDYEEYRAKVLHLFMPEASLDAILKDDFEPILEARETSFLIDVFNERIENVPGLTAVERTAYKARNRALVVNEYYGAYRDLKAGLEALRPYCREAVGVKATGDEKYLRWFAYQLKVKCCEGKEPPAVAQLLAENLDDAIDVYLDAYRHGGKTPKVTSAGTVEENVAYLKSLMDPLLPPIPEVEVVYQDMPSELREGNSTAFYLISPIDDWRTNHIVVADPEHHSNLISTLAHEGFNGHLYQFTYHRALPGLSLSQQLIEGTAYAEAWSQYSELLFAMNCNGRFSSYDMLFDHENGIIFYALLFYLSIRVNWYGDSFDSVYRVFNRYFSVSKSTFRSTYYERFIVGNPLYGIPYAYGYARILDLHKDAEEALGSKYDRKTFDTQYLSYGPTYFDLLADRLERWAKEQ